MAMTAHLETLEQNLRDFVVTNFLFGEAGNLQPDDSFLENGIIDSTGVLELVGYLEQTYQIQVKDNELVPANLDSIRKVASFVQRKLEG